MYFRRKTFTIIPIPKIEKPKKASEHRSYILHHIYYIINILPIYGKTLELVVKEQLEMYLQNNKIITEHQSRFRKNRSLVRQRYKLLLKIEN